MGADTTGSLFLPSPGSTLSGEVDALFNFVLYASIVFFVIVVGFSVFFVIRYRRRSEETRLDTAPSFNPRLEIAWTVIPLVLVIVVFFWGFRTYLKMHIVPKDPVEIKVTAQKWFWSFNYAKDGFTSTNELVVPVDKPIMLTMSSTDVIHSFYVPGFRVKMDVLPNRYSRTWFQATRTGSFDLFCAEYCGTSHSDMIGKVRVLNDREFQAWKEQQAAGNTDMPLKDLGAKLYSSKACITCHSIDGSPMTGPTFKGIYGHQQALSGGNTITVDDNYIRESILSPMAKVAKGFQPVMPSYQGLLKQREIDALVEYIKTLSEEQDSK